MKKTLLTLALVALTTVASYAQGTIAFGNSALTRVQVRELNGTLRNATAQDGLVISAWYVLPGETDARKAAGDAGIGTTAGVMVNAASVFALAGTEPGQVVSLQIRAFSDTSPSGPLRGETDIRQVTLAPTAGPGSVIWQTATGTNPNRFTPLIVNVVPEPSTIALAVLGLGSLLLFRRRK